MDGWMDGYPSYIFHNAPDISCNLQKPVRLIALWAAR